MALGAIYTPKAANEPKDAGAEQKPVAVVTPQPANEGQELKEGANTAPQQPDDLLSRVTQFEIEKNPANKTPDEQDDVLFSDKDLRAKIDAIQDPALKQQYIDMRKSMMRGINEKFQDLASMRKELEAVKNTTQNVRFKANSIDELLSNPEFMNEAKAKLAQSNSPIADESAISDETKQYISSLEGKIKSIEEGLNQKQHQEANNEWNRQHDALAGRYKNYDKSRIDEVANGLITGKIKATPEYIYKVVNHDDNVRRAYELGRKEGSKILNEKRQLNNSIDSVNAVALDTIPQDKAEDNLRFMQRIISKRFAGGAK